MPPPPAFSYGGGWGCQRSTTFDFFARSAKLTEGCSFAWEAPSSAANRASSASICVSFTKTQTSDHEVRPAP